MKVGDIVQWVGFPGADTKGVQITGPTCSGIVVKIYESGVYKFRVDVQWGDGTFGDCLYPQTIEVVDEPLTDDQLELVHAGMNFEAFSKWRVGVLNERG